MDVRLIPATPEQVERLIRANSVEWRGPLSEDSYLEREKLLLDQELTRNGGLSHWALVADKDNLLCGCETTKKPALVGQDGNVNDATCLGVGSVFCLTENRGRGYATTMMTKLAAELSKQGAFSILHSDVGKEFYARAGWKPYEATHVSSAAVPRARRVASVKRLYDADLKDLCAKDVQRVRERVQQESLKRSTVAMAPTQATFAWHHAREDYIGRELDIAPMAGGRGALVPVAGGQATAWCIWTRVWPDKGQDTLHILRLVIDDDRYTDYDLYSELSTVQPKPEHVQAIVDLLGTAQEEAFAAKMDCVELWNPSTTAMAAVQKLHPLAPLTHRQTSNIPCLNWFGKGEVKWICNERYAWC
ncbi:hypothetical protein K470DRAFT_219549 [Piedraia hortae CBS 480.64]|uniref:N-acetyltransferase domain-containing protein n=1 Tax=Piedraia hortae CBS 480.64 TaxID=1314780 RepID=A0A6A7BVR4_9PEZI|nr:hypothetical protein K470DRAFT_219549 [Piedraia hortae CBS 480.64]